MKTLTAALFILIVLAAKGQNFVYPVINKEGKNISDFVLKGWKVLDSAKGDLDNDKKDDLVLIFQYKDSLTVVKKEDDSITIDTFITQPRILAIFFYNDASLKYQLIEQSNSFILTDDYLKLISSDKPSDPYEGMDIHNSVLTISLGYWVMRSNWSYTTKYKFRYQNNDFVLIGADAGSTNRETQDYENYSFNFLTKKWSKTVGNDIKDHKTKTEFHTLDIKELKTLKTLGKPYSWEVIPGSFL